MGCGPSGEATPAGWVAIDLDRSNPERLLRYYFGAYASAEGTDPFATGLLVDQDGVFYLQTDSLAARHPALAPQLDAATADGTLDWEELAAFLQATYYEARALPATREALYTTLGFHPDDPAWFVVEIDGVMTTARRRVFVPKSALRAALTQFRAKDERLHYPQGTAFIGEHWADGALAETTLMWKRADDFWDFAVYDADGQWAEATTTPPRPLKSPTQCVGCHFGSRAFEPEKSFPGEARPGPHGPRTLHIPDAWRHADLVAFFDEHRKRSDTILGLYNTLFTAQLLTDRAAGRLGPEDTALLEALGL